MKNSHKLKNHSLDSPITRDLLDLGAVTQVVEETFSKEPDYKNGAKCNLKYFKKH